MKCYDTHSDFCHNTNCEVFLMSGENQNKIIKGDRIKIIHDKLNLNDIDEQIQQVLKNLCAEFQDTFHLEGDIRVFTNIGEQEIHLKPNVRPIYTKQYRVCPSHRAYINKKTKELLDQGLAEPSLSPWNSPALAVPKDHGTDVRMVIDYRQVNKCVEDDKFPLPHMIDVLDDLNGAKYFSVVDLHQGYYQYF